MAHYPVPAVALSTPLVIDSTALFDEERAKDFATFRMAGRRRFWSTIFVAGILIGGTRFGLTAISWPASLGLFVAALSMNWLLLRVGLDPRTYRWWMRYAFAIFDTILISAVVLACGSPVLIVAYLLAIVPYSFDRGLTLGYVTTLFSAAGFLLASWGHGVINPERAPDYAQILLAAALLLLVSQQVIRMPSRLIRRLRRTRERMIAVEMGDLKARADARHHDELGFLEQSFNRMLDELALLIDTVQQEADELAAVAVQLHGASRQLERRAADVATGAQELRDGLSEQQRTVEGGSRAGRQARDTATTAQERADTAAREARELEDAATSSRVAIEHAAHTLMQVGEGVARSSENVARLQPASDQVREFVETVSRIARQTNMLALNAAIEASRAGEHGAGFAVVADQIRALAVESAKSAKTITKTMQHVRDDIELAVAAMQDTSREVTGASTISRRATGALDELVKGISSVAQQSAEVATLARTQALLAGNVSSAFESADTMAQRAAGQAARAAEHAAAQRSSVEELARSAAQLSAAAGRMRAVVLRRQTAEFPARKTPIATAALSSRLPRQGTGKRMEAA